MDKIDIYGNHVILVSMLRRRIYPFLLLSSEIEVWERDHVWDEHLSYDFGPDVLSPMMPLFNQ